MPSMTEYIDEQDVLVSVVMNDKGMVKLGADPWLPHLDTLRERCRERVSLLAGEPADAMTFRALCREVRHALREVLALYTADDWHTVLKHGYDGHNLFGEPQ